MDLGVVSEAEDSGEGVPISWHKNCTYTYMYIYINACVFFNIVCATMCVTKYVHDGKTKVGSFFTVLFSCIRAMSSGRSWDPGGATARFIRNNVHN